MDEQKRTIYLLSAGFFGIFFAFSTTQSLQSTLNATLGNASLATLYGVFTALCIPGPKLVQYLSPKWAMVLGGATYCLMILANLAIQHLEGNLGAQYGIALPFNFLVGVGAPLLWTGQSLYLSRCADEYVAATGGGKEETRATLSDYNATFFAAFQANGVVGLTFSSLLNIYFKGHGVTDVLFIVLSIVAVIGVVILAFLPTSEAIKADPERLSGNLPADGLLDEKAGDEDEEITIMETLTFLVREPKMYFFIPIIFYNGLSLGFVFGDYTKYVVAEALGSNIVGFGSACFYGANTLATLLYGKAFILRIFGRRGLMMGAFILQAAFFVFYLCLHKTVIGLDHHKMSNFVPPGTVIPSTGGSDGKKWVQPPGHDGPSGFSWVAVFGMVIVFALGDAVWESVVPGVLQAYFMDDGDKAVNAAMANMKLWQSLGFAAQFAIGATFPSIDTSETVLQHFGLKLVILLAWLCIGYGCVFIITARNPVDAEEVEKTVASGELDDDLLGDSRK